MTEEFEVIRANLLPAAGTISDRDMILIVQGGKAKRALPSAMKGKQGDPGLSVFLSVNTTHILWKQGSSGSWQSLIELEQLRGPKGEKPVFRKVEGSLQMKYEGEADTSYVDIFDREELKMKFTDLTPTEVDQLKLHFSDLTDKEKTELMKPATEAATQVRQEMDDITSEADRLKATLLQLETEVKEQEGLRQSSHAQWQTVEEGRQSDELKRKEAEHLRSEAEELRVTSENARSSQETARQAAETIRQQGETSRVEEEVKRTAAEQRRQESEVVRIKSEEERQQHTAEFILDAVEATGAANAAADRANAAATAAEGLVKGFQSDWQVSDPRDTNYIKNKPEIPTLSAVPTAETLTYVNTDGTTVSFRIGDEVRVSDEGEYVFYKLYDLAEGVASWKLAGSGGELDLTEQLVLTLTSNQAQPDASLEGLVVHVRYGDNDTSLTWNGTALAAEIPMNATYRIEFPELVGYATPETKEYTALAGNTRILEASYNTTILAINVSSNQTDKSDLNDLQITLSGSVDDVLTYTGKALVINVPTGKELVISPAQIEGYAPVPVITKMPVASAESVSLVYNTTIVSITLTSNQPEPDTNLIGVLVVVEYDTVTKELTWLGSPLSLQIPTGFAYIITGGLVTGDYHYRLPDPQQGMALGITQSNVLTYAAEKVLIQVSADDGADVSGQTLTVDFGSHAPLSYQVVAGMDIPVYIPLGENYSVSIDAKVGYLLPDEQYFTADTASRMVTITYERIKTSRIIQDEGLGDPASIYGDVNGEAIQQIRAKIRRCLAKKTADGEMTIRYLKNDNSNYYDDGTEAKLDGTEGDVMVYFPDIYYKYEYLDINKFAYSFALAPLDSTWKKFPKSLLSAYEAYALNNKLYSQGGVVSTGNVSLIKLKEYARARGTGYQLIDYDQHRMIAWLFYAIYGNRNSQAVCGSGTDSIAKITGMTNSIGNTDTTAANGNSMSVNFLGLENCWGNKYEFIDDAVINPDGRRVIRVMDTAKGTTRDITGIDPYVEVGWAKLVVAGEYLDIISRAHGASSTTYYSDAQRLTGSLCYLARSSKSNSQEGGVAFISADIKPDYDYAHIGSRLSFRGIIHEAGSVEAFKAIPIDN